MNVHSEYIHSGNFSCYKKRPHKQLPLNFIGTASLLLALHRIVCIAHAKKCTMLKNIFDVCKIPFLERSPT